MLKHYVISLHGQPISVNSMYRMQGVYRGVPHVFLTNRGKKFKLLMAQYIKEQLVDVQNYPNKHVYGIFMIIYNTKKDIDNMFKAVLDSFEGILYKNDMQVRQVYAEKIAHSLVSEEYMSSIFLKGESSRILISEASSPSELIEFYEKTNINTFLKYECKKYIKKIHYINKDLDYNSPVESI